MSVFKWAHSKALFIRALALGCITTACAACASLSPLVSAGGGFSIKESGSFPSRCASSTKLIDSPEALASVSSQACDGLLAASLNRNAPDFSKINIVLFIGPEQPSISRKITIKTAKSSDNKLEVAYAIVNPGGGAASMPGTPYIVAELDKPIREVTFVLEN